MESLAVRFLSCSVAPLAFPFLGGTLSCFPFSPFFEWHSLFPLSLFFFLGGGGLSQLFSGTILCSPFFWLAAPLKMFFPQKWSSPNRVPFFSGLQLSFSAMAIWAVGQHLRARVTQVLVFGSIYQGALGFGCPWVFI